MRLKPLWSLVELAKTLLVWAPIALVGTWSGHPNGPFEVTEQHLEEMKRNFDADPKRRLVVDFNHASLRSPTGEAPAAGWVMEMKIELVDGKKKLLGRIEWLNSCAKDIEAGAYLYLSPTIFWGAVDKVTGKPIGARLHSVALTNTPFLDDLGPIAANDNPENTPKMNALLLQLIGLMALTDTTTEAQAVNAVQGLQGVRLTACAAAGLEPTVTDPAKINAALAQLRRDAEIGRRVCAEAKVALSDADTADAVLVKLKPTLDHAGFVPAASVTELREQLKTKAADELLTRALSEGKVVPATEAWFKGWALSDGSAAKAWLETAPAVLSPADRSRKGAGSASGNDPLTRALSDDEKSAMKQLGLDEPTYRKGLTA